MANGLADAATARETPNKNGGLSFLSCTWRASPIVQLVLLVEQIVDRVEIQAVGGSKALLRRGPADKKEQRRAVPDLSGRWIGQKVVS
jgi:hypothetical protein